MEHEHTKTEEEFIEKYGINSKSAFEIYELGRKSAEGHNEPAPQTIEMFKDLTERITKHFDDDKEWKASVTPSIEVMKSMQNFFSIGAWILKGIILIGAVGSIFVGVYHWFIGK